MTNRFAQNSLNAIVFKLQVILLMMEVKKVKSPKIAITHLAIEIDTQVTHHVVAMEKSS